MIKEISLKNFKCFNEIYLKQLKTLNIIAGKNNYGKTSILDMTFINN
ncbi:AAA family ATPase [Klebsiella pneumoniae]|nr:AAA family ATPase [Klebsiella pneumoniae]